MRTVVDWASSTMAGTVNGQHLLALAPRASTCDLNVESPVRVHPPAVATPSRLTRSIGVLMIANDVLALAGLSGVVAGDMQLRSIGIAG
jgi:hypothetical protein